jgi:DNA-binding CsgD family transcriptional regulator
VTVSWQASSSRLVGRGDELGHLRRLVEGIGESTGSRMVLVMGEAGVGKSRLVKEAAAAAREAGVSVFRGRAVPSGEPYRPLVEALTAALRDRRMPTDAGLRPYLPVLAALLPDAWIEGRPEPRGGAVLGEAVLRLLTALSAGQPAVLMLEDLHWVDPDTLDVLRYLTHAGDSSPLLVVATARDEVDPPPALMELAGASQAEVVTLGRLGDAAAAEVVGSCLPGQPPRTLVDFVVAHADGLPFLIEELLTGLATVGALDRAGRLRGALTANVPRTLAATVRRRLADLDPAARAVVETAAVLGRRFDWRLIPEITGQSDSVVLAGLRAAVASGLVLFGPRTVPGDAGVPSAEPTPLPGEPVPASRISEADTFRFRHALTCDAVRADLLPPEYRAIARASAEVMERRAPEYRDLAAGLWVAAGEDARAAELYVQAGKQARRRGALHTAEGLLSRAATLAGDDDALRRRADLALLEALAGAGDTDRALALGERLLADGETSVRMTLAEVAAAADRWEQASAWLEQENTPDDPRAGVLAARLAHARGEPEQAQRLAEAALAAAREQARWLVACQALQVIGRAARVSDADAARSAFAAAERLAATHDLPLERVAALHELGTIDLLVAGSTAALERAYVLAVEAGALGLAAVLDIQISAGLLHHDTTAALLHAERAAEYARRLQMHTLLATALFFTAHAYAHTRETEHMREAVAAARAIAPDDLDVNAGIWGAVYAQVALIDDDRADLADNLDRAMDFMRASATTTPAPIRGLWALVRTLDDRDGESAREEARPSSVNWENRALLAYADAVVAGRRGEVAEADRQFGSADAAMSKLPWWRHRIRLLIADAAAGDGWGDPVGWAREALAVFVERGDDRLATRCRDVLRRAGAPIPRQGRGDTAVPPGLRRRGVTSREMDVLQLVAAGLPNAEVARKLVLSPRTVETHVTNLLTKTGVDGRAGLIALGEGLRPESASPAEPTLDLTARG